MEVALDLKDVVHSVVSLTDQRMQADNSTWIEVDLPYLPNESLLMWRVSDQLRDSIHADLSAPRQES